MYVCLGVESSLILAKSLLCGAAISIASTCLEACLEACLILAKCLFCSTFYSISIASRPYGQVRLSFAAISIASIEACLILAKSLLCCNFHSLEACLAACLLLAKSLFCSTFHSINGNFYSLEACLPRGLPHPSQASVLLHFPSHPWQSSRPASS